LWIRKPTIKPTTAMSAATKMFRIRFCQGPPRQHGRTSHGQRPEPLQQSALHVGGRDRWRRPATRTPPSERRCRASDSPRTRRCRAAWIAPPNTYRNIRTKIPAGSSRYEQLRHTAVGDEVSHGDGEGVARSTHHAAGAASDLDRRKGQAVELAVELMGHLPSPRASSFDRGTVSTWCPVRARNTSSRLGLANRQRGRRDAVGRAWRSTSISTRARPRR